MEFFVGMDLRMMEALLQPQKKFLGRVDGISNNYIKRAFGRGNLFHFITVLITNNIYNYYYFIILQ